MTADSENALIPDKKIPAAEYYEIITEIAKEYGAVPAMVIYESDSSVVDVPVSIKDNIKGDVNGNGKVDIADIVLLQRYLLGCGIPGTNADINNDGNIDAFDLVLLRKMLFEI